MRPLSPDIQAWIRSLPKTETHLHMEGAVPLEMVQTALPNLFPGRPPFWDSDYRFENFDTFSGMFAEIAGAVFTSAEAYHQCAERVFADLVSQNCQYVETSIALGALVRSHLDGPEVIDAILSAAPTGLTVRVFMGMRHNEYTDLGREMIEDSLSWQDLTGLDLHGPEYLPLEPWTADVWRRARDAGKFNKAHAGEFMPAAFVKRCVEELEVTRIEHGVRAIEDPEVVAFLRDRQITLDVCPISNVKLQVEGISDFASHPILKLIDSGVSCTVSTDDPFLFGNSLNEEYFSLYQELGCSPDQLIEIAASGFTHALAEPAFKDRHRNALKSARI